MSTDLVPTLGEEQQMLLDASIRFMDEQYPLTRVRERADHPAPLDAAYRRGAGELGWFGLLATEAHGGGAASDNGLLDAAVIAAERGARLQPGPFVGHSVVVGALSDALAEGAAGAGAADALATLVTGEAWATWAFGERTGVVLDTDRRLSGRVHAVADAADCAWFLVTAVGLDGTTQVLVPGDAPGVTVAPGDGIDVSRTWSTIELHDVAAELVIGRPGDPTDTTVTLQTQRAAVLAAAETVGAMDTDFAAALQYAKDRIAFGRPIGSFQAIKHILADASLALEMAKGTVAAAARSLGTGAPDGPGLAHAAKAFTAERGVELAHSCFQVFGGIGYTWEHDQHLFFRRIAADAASFGTAEWHRAHLLHHALVTEGAR